jgi:putative membrane protein
VTSPTDEAASDNSDGKPSGDGNACTWLAASDNTGADPPRNATQPGAIRPAKGEGWSRFHPLTPLIKAWLAIAALLGSLVAGMLNSAVGRGDQDASWFDIAELWTGPARSWLLAGLATYFAAVSLWAWLWWRKAAFRVTADSVQLSTGLLIHQRRDAPLDRVQAVDVVRPLIPRLVGLAALRVEVAGGSDSAVVLSYLTKARAADCRRVIMAAVQAAKQLDICDSTPEPAPTGAPTPTALGEFLGDEFTETPEVYAVPISRTIGAIFLGVTPLALALTAAGVVAAYFANQRQIGVGVIYSFGAFAAVVSMLWRRLRTDFAFVAKQTPLGLTLSHGLTTRTAQTIAPGKILAVQLTQSPLWRSLGWWRVKINVAGYGLEAGGPGSTGQKPNDLLLPVGKAETVRQAIAVVAPSLSNQQVWQAVEAAMTTIGPAQGFVTAPSRSQVFDPLAWRRTAFAQTDAALIFRLGRLVRRVQIVPHGRIQAVTMKSGPLERRARLASVMIHSAGGAVFPRIAHLSASQADQLVASEITRLETAMSSSFTIPTSSP